MRIVYVNGYVAQSDWVAGSTRALALVVDFIFCYSAMGGGNPIKHVVCLELENRSFDHMLGFLKQINPDIDGLDGTESNPLNPSDPNSPVVHVTDNADYVTIVDPGHSVHSTTTQLWGDGNVHGDIPAMDG